VDNWNGEFEGQNDNLLECGAVRSEDGRFIVYYNKRKNSSLNCKTGHIASFTKFGNSYCKNWETSFPDESNIYFYNDIALKDGVIYTAVSGGRTENAVFHSGIYAFDLEGKIKWVFPVETLIEEMGLNGDWDFFVMDVDGYYYQLGKDGHLTDKFMRKPTGLKYEKMKQGELVEVSRYEHSRILSFNSWNNVIINAENDGTSSCIEDDEGNIIFYINEYIDETHEQKVGRLLCFSSNLKENWKFSFPKSSGLFFINELFLLNDMIYVRVSSSKMGGEDAGRGIYTFDMDGKYKWHIPIYEFKGAIGIYRKSGSIFVQDTAGNSYVIDKHGNLVNEDQNC